MLEQNMFGKAMVSCDVIDGGLPELVVSAPTRAVRIGVKGYHRYGAVYVYQWTGSAMTLAATYVSSAATNKSYFYSSNDCDTTGATCGSSPNDPLARLWLNPSLPFGAALGTSNSGLYTGWTLSCEPRAAGGGDRLWVGEPGYATLPAQQEGRMLRLSYASGSFTEEGALVGTANEAFGASAVYLPSFDYGASCSGEVLAVGAPNKSGKGAVYLYEKASDAWSYCDTIAAEAGDAASAGFGTQLAYLGDMVGSGNSKTELAVGATPLTAPGSCLGFVRVFGDGSTTALKHAGVACTDPLSIPAGFGMRIARIGDYDGDAKGDIAIGAPYAHVNGFPQTGAAYVFRWADLGAGATVSPTTPHATIKGAPSPNGYFSTGALAVPAAAGYDAVPKLTLFGRPGMTPQMGPLAQNDACNIAPPQQNTGQNGTGCQGVVEEYAKSSLKFGEPSRLVGNAEDAQFGRSVVVAPDMDADTIPDLIVGQPGGRCAGLNWGSLMVLSGKDTSEIRNVCGPTPGSRLGDFVGVLPNSDSNKRIVGFSVVTPAGGSVRIASRNGVPPGPGSPDSQASLLGSFSWTTLPGPECDGSYDPGGGAIPTPGPGVFISPVRTAAGDDYFTIAQPTGDTGGKGVVQFVRMANGGVDYGAHKYVVQGVVGTGFGASADVGSYVVGMSAVTVFDVIGAPAIATVHICKHRIPAGSNIIHTVTTGCDNVDATWFKTLARKPGDATKFVLSSSSGATVEALAGTTILDDFGSLVVALPDLDGPDGTSYDAFLFVSNTNAKRTTDSTRQAQYFILGINLVGTNPGITGSNPTGDRVKVYSVATDSDTGTLLGGAAHVVGDIDKDADLLPELVIASPKGIGTYGDTGHVRVVSLAKLKAAAAAETLPTPGLLQVIFNPDEGASNFGIAAASADYNGDGTKDLLIGADEYSGSGLSNAGAVYFFPLEGVKR